MYFICESWRDGHRLALALHACDPSTQQADAGDRESKTRLGCMLRLFLFPMQNEEECPVRFSGLFNQPGHVETDAFCPLLGNISSVFQNFLLS